MDTVYALFWLAVIIGAVIVWRKFVRFSSKEISQKVLYRSEYEEGQRMTAGLTVKTSASIPTIMDQLKTHVVTDEAPLGFNAVVYEAARGADRVTYAFGNKLVPMTFRAVVACTDHDGSTDAVFTVLNWKERDGIIVAQEKMRELRKQVKAAFRAADPSALFAEGMPNDSSVRARLNVAAADAPVATMLASTSVSPETSNEAAPAAAPVEDGTLAPSNEAQAVTGDASKTQTAKTLETVGIVMAIIGFVKVSFLGFTASEAPLFFGLLVAGGVCVYIASKMKSAVEIDKDDDIAGETK